MEDTTGANSPIRLYTDFEPYSIWHRKEDADILDVHLNGFKKEQAKVQINRARILTISGERPLDDNKSWSRFRKQIKLADNTKDDDVRAKLTHGVLSVVIPKKPQILSFSVTLPSDVLQTAQTQDVSAQPKPEKPTTTAAAEESQKGNDTVPALEDAELSGMTLGSYIMGQKESGGWKLKMDKNMGIKVGVVLIVFLLVVFGFLCERFM
ncbi:hypothetical protein FEM48_Zijuj05G0185300 [Ziziphus jujuba var. spinosa]|uniref:SHSP domain-containing protein n=1 Tax=Ziziphus jujuba var. spinosa TaxID=714518 RepID=A0A978VGG2_ZIZJJ|nr:hypothetical protein FEM48_Zijuj05G0185300 [Ziziphus jujuba var. spinosa]